MGEDMDQLRIGLVGAGAVGVLHAEAAERVPQVVVTAVADVDESAARRLAQVCGAAWYTDHRALLDAGAVDAVLVNTPHARHAGIVVDAAGAGVAVLVEKPLATSLADCDAMAGACADAGVCLAVGHIQHFLPDKVAAFRAIADGAVGAPRLVVDRRSTDYTPGSRPAWFLDPGLAGGGVLANLGAHCIDRAQWLTGQDAVAVSATVVRPDGYRVETDVVARLDLNGGATAAISVLGSGVPGPDLVTVVGERGTVAADPRAGAVLRAGGTTRQLSRPAPDDIPRAFADQLTAFVASVRDGAPPAVDVAYGRRVVATVLAGYESARTGRPIPVSEPPR